MIDIAYINKLIAERRAEELADYIKAHNLVLTDDNRLLVDKEHIKYTYEYYDKRQLVRKILLNSALIPSALVQ